MHDVLLAMPSPLGFSMANNALSFCPTVKSLYAKLGDYRLLQDQARPEYAVLYTNERVATVELGVVKDLPAVSYTTQFDSQFELLWLKSVQIPDNIIAQTAIISSTSNRANYMVKVATEDLAVAKAVFDEQVTAHNAVLLRFHGNLRKRDLDGVNVELISGDTIAPPEGKRAHDHYIVSTASDEVIGTAHNRGDNVDYYSINIVTADVQLAAAILAACGMF